MQAGKRYQIRGATGNINLFGVIESGIPVMGHIGLTPQFMHMLGGFKVQGKKICVERLKEDALMLQEAVVLP